MEKYAIIKATVKYLHNNESHIGIAKKVDEYYWEFVYDFFYTKQWYYKHVKVIKEISKEEYPEYFI